MCEGVGNTKCNRSGAGLRADPLRVDLSLWPSREQLTEAQRRVRAAQGALRSAWASVPAAMKSGSGAATARVEASTRGVRRLARAAAELRPPPPPPSPVTECQERLPE